MLQFSTEHALHPPPHHPEATELSRPSVAALNLPSLECLSSARVFIDLKVQVPAGYRQGLVRDPRWPQLYAADTPNQISPFIGSTLSAEVTTFSQTSD